MHDTAHSDDRLNLRLQASELYMGCSELKAGSSFGLYMGCSGLKAGSSFGLYMGCSGLKAGSSFGLYMGALHGRRDLPLRCRWGAQVCRWGAQVCRWGVQV